MFPFLRKLFIPILLLCATACSNSETDTPVAAEGSRTILVYMAAANSLGDGGCDTADLTEMRQAVRNGHLQGGRLLVYHATRAEDAKLLEITPKGDNVIATYGADGLTSVHGARMAGVIADARRAAPAESFGLVLWSHGNGWLQNGINDPDYPRPEDGTPRLRTWGEENFRTMNITTLAEVLEQSHPDFVYFDCCYMAGVEVAYELRHATDYIVASATELPGDGMPYHRTLQHLFNPEGADLQGAAEETFRLYDGQADPEDRTCTIAVIVTAGLDDLAAAARTIFSATPVRYPDGFQPQAFQLSTPCRFSDLNQYLLALNYSNPDSDAAIRNENKWTTALHNTVLYAAATPRLWDKIDIRAHCGLSTYVTEDEATLNDTRHYNTLQWPHDSGRIPQ